MSAVNTSKRITPQLQPVDCKACAGQVVLLKGVEPADLARTAECDMMPHQPDFLAC